MIEKHIAEAVTPLVDALCAAEKDIQQLGDRIVAAEVDRRDLLAKALAAANETARETALDAVQASVGDLAAAAQDSATTLASIRKSQSQLALALFATAAARLTPAGETK